MDENTFWQIIQRVHNKSPNMQRKCQLITEEVARLTKEDAVEFYHHFRVMMNKAYAWSLWDAAYIIHGGCGDDTFSDFRASLISRGKETFNRALCWFSRNPTNGFLEFANFLHALQRHYVLRAAFF